MIFFESVDEELNAICEKFEHDNVAAWKKAREFCKSHGATAGKRRDYAGKDSFSLAFPLEEFDVKIFKEVDSDHKHSYCQPRRKHRKICSEFDQINSMFPSRADINKVIKQSFVGSNSEGMFITPANFTMLCGTWIFGCPDDYKGCDRLQRISDVEYEALLEQHKKAQRKPRRKK